MCGRNQEGQLGLGNLTDEFTPYFVNRIPEKINNLACGDLHTLVLTVSGQMYAMGDNKLCQLGTGEPNEKPSALPLLLEDISSRRVTKIRAGKFSAAMSPDGEVYVWGTGEFGQFASPCLMKTQLDVVDIQVSRLGLACLVGRQGDCYTWGANEQG